MKLITYLVPDDFHGGNFDLPEGTLTHGQHFSSHDLRNVEAWKRAGRLMSLAFWRANVRD